MVTGPLRHQHSSLKVCIYLTAIIADSEANLWLLRHTYLLLSYSLSQDTIKLSTFPPASTISWRHTPTNTRTNTTTYRYFAVEAGSLDGRSGVHTIFGLCRVTQLAWSPSGLHFTNL